MQETHEPARSRIILALHASPYPLDRRTSIEMATCADSVRFYIDPDSERVRPWLHRCRKRLCPLCGKARSAQAAHDIHLAAATMRDARHMILTLKSSDAPLPQQLDKLRDSFVRLRRSPLWKSSVKGGIAVTETSWNSHTGQWHPHLHILYDGSFIKHSQLAAAWSEASDGSYIVWLRRCDSHAAIAAELSKYISKPANLAVLPDDNIPVFNRATHRRHMLTKFGSCHGLKLRDEDPAEPLGPNAYHVSIQRVMYLAHQGAHAAQRLLIAIANRFPMVQGYIYHSMPLLDPPELPTRRTLRILTKFRNDRSYDTERAPPNPADRTARIEADLIVAFRRYHAEETAGALAKYDHFYAP